MASRERIPLHWEIGDTRRYSSYTSEFSIEAKQIGYENYKITDLRRRITLYHSSCKNAFILALRGFVEDYSLTLEVEELAE